MPVYNEEAGLAEIIRRVAAVPVDKEIIVVDDCSSDATPRILAALDTPNLRVIRHPVNRGKGAAIRTAIEAIPLGSEAAATAVIIQDADLEYDPQDYGALLRPMLEQGASVVYGVRDLSGQKWAVRSGNRALTALTNLLYGSRLHDMETCYKLMLAPIARSLRIECNRFDLEPEITAKILRQGYTIAEVPVSYTPRVAKKLSPWRDGWPALRALWRYRRWQPNSTGA
jgi:glycosyltransferase involved in cell wall biosynthesis